jgi:hypothetical protein
MWGQDSKVRDLRGYEADELPDCSTPRRERVGPRKLGQRRVWRSGPPCLRKGRALGWRSRSRHAQESSTRGPREG